MEMYNLCNRGMAWNPDIARNYESIRNEQKSNIESSCKIILDRTPAAAINITESVKQVYDSKNAVTVALSILKAKTDELKIVVEKLDQENKQTKREINKTKQVLKEMRATYREKRIIDDLRKEQADSLNRKTLGNLHSSMMGLWRPLREESRIGLLISAIAFFLVTIAIIVYAIMKGYIGGSVSFQTSSVLGGISAYSAGKGVMSTIFPGLL